MASRNHLVSALLLIGVASASFAQTAPSGATDDLQSRAQAAVQASEWDKAAVLFAEITAGSPTDANAWYQLGLTTIRAGGDVRRARAAFARAMDLGFPPGPSLFGIAKTHALANEPADAMDTLDQLAKLGPAPAVAPLLGTDEAFAAMRSSARFQALVTQLTPCTSAEYRQFDFWLGRWDVLSPQGQQLGTNIVERVLDGCALTERWESGRGGKGMSINSYDRDKGTWSQIYRDSTGNVTQWPELVGGLVGDAMVLETAADASPRSRWTWTPTKDGRVRQMAETSSDNGATWNVVWDSYYQQQSE